MSTETLRAISERAAALLDHAKDVVAVKQAGGSVEDIVIEKIINRLQEEMNILLVELRALPPPSD